MRPGNDRKYPSILQSKTERRQALVFIITKGGTRGRKSPREEGGRPIKFATIGFYVRASGAIGSISRLIFVQLQFPALMYPAFPVARDRRK